jgi:hypothetical protein
LSKLSTTHYGVASLKQAMGNKFAKIESIYKRLKRDQKTIQILIETTSIQENLTCQCMKTTAECNQHQQWIDQHHS